LKCLARVKHVQRTLTEQWSVLATLTPPSTRSSEARWVAPRGFSPSSTGGGIHPGQQERRHAAGVPQRAGGTADAGRHPGRADVVRRIPPVPARAGHRTSEILDRDVTQPWCLAELIPLFRKIYEQGSDRARRLGVYEACEDLVDLEDNFQAWRFATCGPCSGYRFKSGTGGSSGVAFLRAPWT